VEIDGASACGMDGIGMGGPAVERVRRRVAVAGFTGVSGGVRRPVLSDATMSIWEGGMESTRRTGRRRRSYRCGYRRR
jgi:hypothetical protein